MKHLFNDQDVVCVPEKATLREAADLMAEREIGSVVVVDGEGRARGILTDRDLCLRAVAWDRDPDQERVSEVMTHGVRSVSIDATRSEQVQPMRRLGVRRVPLVDAEERPVGLVASDDWLRWIAERLMELSATADPARRHGRLRPPAELLDELERHLDAGAATDEGDGPLAERQRLDRDELLEAIARLRAQMA